MNLCTLPGGGTWVDSGGQENSALGIREIARHTPDLAKLIVNAGGVAAMVNRVCSCIIAIPP